jgi:SAM-dependent methyltransferase
MVLKAIHRLPFLARFYQRHGQKWAQKKISLFEGYLKEKERILDLGCGNCVISDQLLSKGYQVTPMDIKDLSIVNSVNPLVYDGHLLPFEEKKFDTVLLLTVLHHSQQPIINLEESKRTGKQIILLEDTYSNRLQKFITQSMDTLVNFGHSPMTFQNRSEQEWEEIFAQLKLKIIGKKRLRTLFFFRQTLYLLQTD